MPTVLHFDEAKDETLAGRRGDIDEIWAGVFLAVSLAPSQWGEQVPYIIDGNDEPILERDPAVLTCQSTPAVGMRHRQGNQLRGSRPVAGEADGEPTAERLQILQEELGVAAAAAQPHLIERAVDQVANLVEMRGGGDQLEATEVFAFRHAVDDVGIVYFLVVPWRIEVLDAGVAVQGDNPVAEPVQLREAVGLLAGNLRLQQG